MPRKPTQNIRLNDRDYEILHHIMRYHMTTREVLHKLFFSDSDVSAVTKVTSRLSKHEYLNSHELYAPRKYFTLGLRAARFLGVSARKTGPLGAQSKAREYGTLAYCCLSEHPRQRLMVREISERHSAYLQPKINTGHYYLDNDGQITRLAYIYVAGATSLDSIVRKCRAEQNVRYAYEAYARLMDEDRFMIAVVTPTEEKAALAKEALARYKWKVRFRVECVPDLIYLT